VTRVTSSRVSGKEEPRALVQKCCRNIQTALGIPHRITFEAHTAAKHQEVYSLVGFSVAETEKQYQVIPIPGLDNFWLAASWSFEYYKGASFLINASLLVFRGIATDRKKSALLRAEWAPPDQIGGWSHAQPHWHIYQAEIDSEQTTGRQGFQTQLDMELGAVAEPGTTSFLKQNEISHFHFAMASQWQINGNHQIELESKTMLSWLSGCLEYIVSELNFLRSRATSFPAHQA